MSRAKLVRSKKSTSLSQTGASWCIIMQGRGCGDGDCTYIGMKEVAGESSVCRISASKNVSNDFSS